MQERTIVAWNGSESSDAALKWAIKRERDRHGTVEMAYIIGDDRVSLDYLAMGAKLAQARERVDAEAMRVGRDEPNVTLNTQSRWGDPLDELVEFTRSDTVVVVGTSQRHGVGLRYRRPLGARLAARAHGPVIVVPFGTNSGERAGVYVGIAGNEGGNLALDFAARESSLRGETLHIVHAWTEQPARRKGTVPDEKVVESLAITHQSMLAQTVKSVEESYPSLKLVSHLVREDPAVALLNLAASAELLVMGARQHHGRATARLGSVSHASLSGIVCPTAVVSAEELK